MDLFEMDTRHWSGKELGCHGNMTYEGTDIALTTTSVHARWEPGTDYNCLDYRSLMVEAVVLCQSETKIIQFMTNQKIKTTRVEILTNLSQDVFATGLHAANLSTSCNNANNLSCCYKIVNLQVNYVNRSSFDFITHLELSLLALQI
jgi:hypothetical protein